jgi:hypothetical protein
MDDTDNIDQYFQLILSVMLTTSSIVPLVKSFEFLIDSIVHWLKIAEDFFLLMTIDLIDIF